MSRIVEAHSVPNSAVDSALVVPLHRWCIERCHELRWQAMDWIRQGEWWELVAVCGGP